MARLVSRIASSSAWNSSRGDTLSMPVAFTRLVPGVEPGTEHHGLATLVARVEEQPGAAGAAVDHQNRPRLYHAGQIEELIRLAQRLLPGPFGGALYDGHRVADLRHHLGAPGRVLIRREDIREDRLRRQGPARVRVPER